MQHVATHRARFYFVPCFYNEHTHAMWCENWLLEKILGAVIWIHIIFCVLTGHEKFPITLIEEIKQGGE